LLKMNERSTAMAKKPICLLVVGLALVLTPFLVLAEQPDMGGTPVPPPADAPEPQMPEYIYQTGTPDLERVKSFYESQEEVLGQRVVELLDYVDSPDVDSAGGPTIVGAGYGADGYYSVLLDSWNDNWDVIDRTVERLQELGGEDFPIAFWVGTFSCGVKTLDAEEVETAGAF
jgi:catechol 2,3-dioxygenase-like lactoylglutathione lyase family enzyme